MCTCWYAVLLTPDGDADWSCTRPHSALSDLPQDQSLVRTCCAHLHGRSGQHLDLLSAWTPQLQVLLIPGTLQWYHCHYHYFYYQQSLLS